MRIGTAALALAFALGVAGFVAAQEPTTGSWWSRVPLPWGKSADAKKDLKKDEPPPGPSVRERRSLANAALARRQEVCQRLQEIAYKLGDEDVRQKAEDLAERAWEAHSAAMVRIRRVEPVNVESDVKKKEKRK